MKTLLLRNSSGRPHLRHGFPVVLFALVLLLLIASSTNGVIISEGELRNVSTRLAVLTGENVLIAGFTVAQSQQVLVRALGPTLTNFGVTGALADPTSRCITAPERLSPQTTTGKTPTKPPLPGPARRPQ